MRRAALLGALAVCISGCIDDDVQLRAAGFRITNAGDRPLYIQSSGWSGQGYYQILRDGVALRESDACEICNCAGCPMCAVCDRTIAEVKALQPGDIHEFQWDGLAWRTVTNGCRPTLECEQPDAVAAGPLAVRVTYSDSFAVDTTAGASDELIGPAMTAEVTFAHPAAGTVEIAIRWVNPLRRYRPRT